MSNQALDEMGDVTPQQFFADRRNPHCLIFGERKLLFAALEDGVRCFLGDIEACGGRMVERLRLQREAQDWVFDDSLETPYGFTYRQACEEFSIDAEALRTQLIRLRSQDLGAGERKRIAKVRVFGQRLDGHITSAERHQGA